MFSRALRNGITQAADDIMLFGCHCTFSFFQRIQNSFFIEGLFARLMYRSLYKMHEMALHGPWKVFLDTLSRSLTRRTEPVVKLH